MNLLNYADLAEPILLYSGLIWREVVQKTFNSGPWVFFWTKNFVHDLDSLQLFPTKNIYFVLIQG